MSHNINEFYKWTAPITRTMYRHYTNFLIAINIFLLGKVVPYGPSSLAEIPAESDGYPESSW